MHNCFRGCRGDPTNVLSLIHSTIAKRLLERGALIVWHRGMDRNYRRFGSSRLSSRGALMGKCWDVSCSDGDRGERNQNHGTKGFGNLHWFLVSLGWRKNRFVRVP